MTKSDQGQRIIEIARSYIGQREIPENQGWYDKDFEAKIRKATGWRTSQPWCAALTKLILMEAYAGTARVATVKQLCTLGAVRTYRNWEAQYGHLVSKEPYPGALIVWRQYVDRKPHPKGFGHIGIVDKIVPTNTETVLLCIEGNTNEEGGRDGDTVAEKKRKLSFVPKERGLVLLGFIHPFGDE